jgi:hypothetical protein
MKHAEDRHKARPRDKKSTEEDRKLDEALEESFPASDPPAATQPHDRSPGGRDRPPRRREDPKSKQGK